MLENQSISSLAIIHEFFLKINKFSFLIKISLSLSSHKEERKIKLIVKSGHGLI